jgi:hypothetical protein
MSLALWRISKLGDIVSGIHCDGIRELKCLVQSWKMGKDVSIFVEDPPPFFSQEILHQVKKFFL